MNLILVQLLKYILINLSKVKKTLNKNLTYLRRIYILTITLLLFFVSDAQTIDSVANKNEKSFFKGWRIAGFSIGIGVWQNFDKSSGLSLFQNTTSSNVSETKLNNDLENIKNYSNWSVDFDSYGENVTVPLRIVLKPKKIEHGKLKSYVELNLALLYSLQHHTTYLEGWESTSSTTKSYNTSYRVETRNFAIDGLITLQTPGIFSLFSLYSGIGVNVGGNFDNFVYSSASLERERDNNPFSTSTSKTIISSTNSFYLPVASFGFYTPLGLKLNISKHSNLFIEYTFSRKTLVFSDLYPKSFWYKGFGVGYRYKISKKKKKKIPISTPAKSPKPFY